MYILCIRMRMVNPIQQYTLMISSFNEGSACNWLVGHMASHGAMCMNIPPPLRVLNLNLGRRRIYIRTYTTEDVDPNSHAYDYVDIDHA